jgi:hypothetical protein
MLRRPRRIADRPLADRVFARALTLGATYEHPTEDAVHNLWSLAGGDREVLTRAFNRLTHPTEHVGSPGVVAAALLKSALSYDAVPADGDLEQAGGG